MNATVTRRRVEGPRPVRDHLGRIVGWTDPDANVPVRGDLPEWIRRNLSGENGSGMKDLTR